MSHIVKRNVPGVKSPLKSHLPFLLFRFSVIIASIIIVSFEEGGKNPSPVGKFRQRLYFNFCNVKVSGVKVSGVRVRCSYNYLNPRILESSNPITILSSQLERLSRSKLIQKSSISYS